MSIKIYKRAIATVQVVIALFVLNACSNEEDCCAEPYPETTPPIDISPGVITGFNMRWIDTNEFTSETLEAISNLKPEMLRYPGGTLAHHWDWRTGKANPSWPAHINHLISDIKVLTEAAESSITFVVDVVHGNVQDQIEMLHAADVPITHIELGNELYASDYETVFPDGKAYADTINKWLPQLKIEFPQAKFGAAFIGRTAGDDRKNEWNQKLHNNLNVEVNAYIYHLYVGETETVEERIARYDAVKILPENKELWVTEYGARSYSVDQTIELADYIESIADVALNHCLVTKSGSFSKFEYGTNNYTTEGLAFINRVN